MSDKDTLRAANYLDEFADMIFNSETIGGKWVNALAGKREHDDLRRLAKRLRGTVLADS